MYPFWTCWDQNADSSASTPRPASRLSIHGPGPWQQHSRRLARPDKLASHEDSPKCIFFQACTRRAPHLDLFSLDVTDSGLRQFRCLQPCPAARIARGCFAAFIFALCAQPAEISTHPVLFAAWTDECAGVLTSVLEVVCIVHIMSEQAISMAPTSAAANLTHSQAQEAGEAGQRVQLSIPHLARSALYEQ